MTPRDAPPSPAGFTLPTPAVQATLVALVCFALSANTLFNGFVVDDDQQVLRNPWIRHWGGLADIFSRSDWSFARDANASNYYRPLRHVLYLLLHQTVGLRARAFHLLNLLIHTANTLLVFGLAWQLNAAPPHDAPDVRASAREHVPLIAALLFAAHPVHTEAVAWVAAVTELGFSGCFLLALFCCARAVRPFGAPHWLAAVAFFLSLLFKETAITFLLMLLAWDAVFRPARRSRTETLARWAPFALAAGLYLALRWWALAGALLAAVPPSGRAAIDLALSAPALFAKYLRLLALPIGLNYWRSFHPPTSFLEGSFLLSALVTVGFVAALVLAYRANRIVYFCGLLIAVPLLPALYRPGLQGGPFGERYLYLPSVGFVIAAASLVGARGRLSARAVWSVTLPVVVACGAATVTRNAVWRDSLTLLSDTVRRSPDASLPRYDLGITLVNADRVDEAIGHFRIVVAAEPDNVLYRSALGGALVRTGQLDEAIEHLRVAVARNPHSRASSNDLGVALRRAERIAEAERVYEQILAFDPEYEEAHYNLGAILADAGRTAEAIEHYRAAVRAAPDNAFYRNALGIEYGRQGLLPKAAEQFEAAVRLAPDEPAYRNNLRRATASQGMPR